MARPSRTVPWPKFSGDAEAVSTFVQVEVPCPSCGETTTRVVATSINATRTPEWRDVILEGSFQRSACSTCGEYATPLIAFPYIDFDRKQYIGVFPVSDEHRWPELEHEPEHAFVRNLGGLAPPIARPIGAGFEVRTVFGLGALREKIVALSGSIDDAALEVLKLRLLVSRDDLSASLDARPRLVEIDPAHLRFQIHVEVSDDESDLYRLDVPMDDYLAIAGDPSLAPIMDEIRAGPYRDCARMLPADPGVTSAITARWR